eukprot:2497777-Amphidinium_carterae.1
MVSNEDCHRCQDSVIPTTMKAASCSFYTHMPWSRELKTFKDNQDPGNFDYLALKPGANVSC